MTPELVGPHSWIGRVFKQTALPTSAGYWFAVHPVAVSGDPAEGASPTLVMDPSITRYVLALGSAAPKEGDDLICSGYKGYVLGSNPFWVTDRMGRHDGIWISEPGCPCKTIPTTLHLTGANPATDLGIFQDATLVYGPTPPEYFALALGSSSFLSTGYYPDSTTGDLFQYYFTCYNGYYALTRVYKVSFYGSPYLDVIRYRWLVGIQGNTCGPPFRLVDGQVYAGGSTQHLALSGSP